MSDAANEILETSDGSPTLFSNQFGVTYHSRFGAIEETQHVFINAALRYKAVLQKDIAVLDIGFGTGLNAFATYLEAEKRGLTIDYTAVEAYPVDTNLLAELNYAELYKKPETDSIFQQMHLAPWGTTQNLSSSFTFVKLLQKFESLDFTEQFDLIYFDAFAPNSQPELWTVEIMEIMFKALRPEGALTTYCAKGQVKRNMRAAGFTVERLPGPPRKREMTRALKVANL